MDLTPAPAAVNAELKRKATEPIDLMIADGDITPVSKKARKDAANVPEVPVSSKQNVCRMRKCAKLNNCYRSQVRSPLPKSIASSPPDDPVQYKMQTGTALRPLPNPLKPSQLFSPFPTLQLSHDRSGCSRSPPAFISIHSKSDEAPNSSSS